MSYLNPLRLHFAGRFQANVSTVNNDPGHFDNAIFQPSYQQMQGINFNPPNGWFNPEGDAGWRFLGCRVTSAWMPVGQVQTSDPVLSYIVADADTQAPAKLVDLDPEQQLVSELWGMQVRIADANGNTLLRGDYDPAAFIDIWDRATVSAGGDADASAAYQSVLRNLQWGHISHSPFLTALKLAAADGLLSIKFNVDAFNLDYTSPDFMTGRIVGTIGPAAASEPTHMVIGRYFMADAAASDPYTKAPPNFFWPVGSINFCSAVVDATANLIYLDLGNALPTGTGGTLVDLGDITLGVYDPLATPGNPAGITIPVATIASGGATGYAADADWYSNTAGIVVLPIPPVLTPKVQSSALALTGNQGVALAEWNSAAYVRADKFVYRLNPGDTAQIPVYAMQYGMPVAAGTQISFVADASQLQAQVGDGFPFITQSPPVATPASALTFSASAPTGDNGCATLMVKASDPGTPRNFNGNYGIDGQVYGIRPGFVDTQTYGNGPINQWDFVSFLLWSAFTPKVPGTPTWGCDLQPIFQQYANLYPVMNRFLNLADYESVKQHGGLLNLAFGLPVSNPNSMPVTRDLSQAKREAILHWLQNGTPLGDCPPATVLAVQPAAQAPSATAEPVNMNKGGKAYAASRRLVHITVRENKQ